MDRGAWGTLHAVAESRTQVSDYAHHIAYLNGLFKSEFVISSSSSEPQSAPGPVFANCIELLHLQLQRCVHTHTHTPTHTHTHPHPHIFLHSSVDGHFSFFCITLSFNLHSLILCILKSYLPSFLELRLDVNKERQCLIHLCIL